MNTQLDEAPGPDDPRLLQAVQEYLQELEAGRQPSRRALADRFPDLREAITPYLDALDMVHAASPLLPRPESSAAPGLCGELSAAEPLGDFRIVREIGRGGMGVVYEAVQRSLGRRVAVKVLPFAAALDAKQLQRFKNEAQAAAQLHHTNIVPVYAVGAERGVHFYAMQLIEGQNLASLIAELRRIGAANNLGDAGPQREGEPTGPYLSKIQQQAARAIGADGAEPKPSVETQPGLGLQLSTQRSSRVGDFFGTVTRLAAQAAEGLDYAHGIGIIHRDIKPANLLVDARGNVWITDFGLAQFHADAGLTQTGDFMGTLRYMSPEQAGGQRVLIDHRTDVYSLGATLYELLTLQPIFGGSDRQTLLRQILHEEPRSPRDIDRSIPGELETIVLKAVSKLPGDRYATAREFAEDLHRFLRHEPILARRATAVQRVRKWLRRHPSVPVAATVLLVLLAAGSFVSTWLIRGAYERERQRAEEAEKQFRLARRSVDEMIRIAEEELTDAPPLQGPRRLLLEAALAYYQEFIEQRRDNPDDQAGLQVTRDRVKSILTDLTILSGSWQHFLLGESSVQDDLQLSAKQREQVGGLLQEITERHPEPFRQFHRLSAEERSQRFVEAVKQHEAAIESILTQNQRARLRQIGLQVAFLARGSWALTESDVAAALKLTAEQRDRLRGLGGEMFMGRPDPFRSGPPPRPQRGPPDRPFKAGSEESLAVLSPEQRQRWEELTGAPFKGALPVFRPGPPPVLFGAPR